MSLINAGLFLGRSEPQGTPTDNRTRRRLPKNINDVLDKYSLEQLRQFLNARNNKSLYRREPAELNGLSDEQMADNIILREKTIYGGEGSDRRKDYFEIADRSILQVADSVAAIVDDTHLREDGDSFRIIGRTFGETFDCCSGVSFSGQMSAAECTAFVVASDIIATAGHCASLLGTAHIVFGFRVLRTGMTRELLSQIPKSQIYKPAQVLIAKQDAGVDFALVRLDRSITGHAPLPLESGHDVGQGTIVYALGYPMGLPLKLADSAIVNRVVPAGYFVSNLDTFGGNSGSPVLSVATNRVVGVLVRGGTDLKRVGKCNIAFPCPVMPDNSRDCGGEAATLITQLVGSLKSLNNNSFPVTKSIVKTFRSGLVVSGSRKAFSSEYKVTSDEPPAGYKIGTYVFSLSGDRGCNAWSTCSAAIEGNRVVFRFTLQGHDEWPPPGQAQSEGFLTVTYVPEAQV